MTAYPQVWAVFSDARAARAIVDRWPDAEVYAAEPTETLAGVHSRVRAPFGGIALAGGILGGLVGGGIAAGTFSWMSLHVGGLPHFPVPPIGIVTFAITALGAIGASVVFLLVQGRMLGFRLAMPEDARRRVASGDVAVMLRVHEEERAAVARELAAAGAEVL